MIPLDFPIRNEECNMKRVLVFVALAVSLGLIGSYFAEPASAFFGRGPGPTCFTGAAPYCAPVYGYYRALPVCPAYCYGYGCKVKKFKKAQPKPQQGK
jgi:hypothetical protein